MASLHSAKRESLRRAFRRLWSDRRSGSSYLALRAARMLRNALAGRTPAPPFDIRHFARRSAAAFPTMGLLATLDERLQRALGSSRAWDEPALTRTREALESFISEIADARNRAAVTFVRAAGKRRRFLTLSMSGSVIDALSQLAKTRRIEVVVCESRPAFEGRLTASRLRKAGCRTSLIHDAAMGSYLMEVDAVVLGADWVDHDGFINKTGSLALSLLAGGAGIPVFVIADSLRCPSRPRPARTGRNPIFEFVPWSSHHRLITETPAARRPR
ncbi:MAG: hypothetical protein AB1752_11540 [Candidatus Zixiibacteriota bacterium]